MLVLHTFHGETLEMSENESAVLLPSRSYANIEEMGAVVISSRMKISHVASAHFFLLSLGCECQADMYHDVLKKVFFLSFVIKCGERERERETERSSRLLEYA